MLINPKKLLRRKRQLKGVIGTGGKEFKILHKQFDEIYNKKQQKKLRKRAIGGGRQGVIKDTKSNIKRYNFQALNYYYYNTPLLEQNIAKIGAFFHYYKTLHIHL